jgi:hypothetical protein
VNRPLRRLVDWAEHEVRARPALYSAYYRAVTSSALLSRAAGRLKQQVRRPAGGAPDHDASCPEPPALARRRAEVVRARLGLPSP